MTRVIDDKQAFRAAMDDARASGVRTGLVPTMGALHDGHMALVDEAKRRGAGFIALTLFVNPTQFGPNDDFSRYPRTFEADLARCRASGVDVLFAPQRESMYPEGFSTVVEVKGVTDTLEGTHRPGHFAGVTTIVLKLFAQWKVIERMTRDLDLPIEVVGMPTVREPDGLALSSRNRYLSDEERTRALGIARGIRAAMTAFARGERVSKTLESLARGEIEPAFDSIDYVTVADPETFAVTERTRERALLVVAARIGKTRLIDNAVLGEDVV
jgi:pantoate--beta-alanine ligase